MDLGVLTDVGEAIGTEGADVGEAPGIDRIAWINLGGGVVMLEICNFAVEVISKQAYITQAIQKFGVQETDAVKVDYDGALDSSSTGVTHPAPVLEGFAYQYVGRDCSYGLVPILYLYGG